MTFFLFFRKAGTDYKKTFNFPINYKGNNVKAEKITFTGYCCWEIHGRKTKTSRKLQIEIVKNSTKRNHTPEYPFLLRLRTCKCL